MVLTEETKAEVEALKNEKRNLRTKRPETHPLFSLFFEHYTDKSLPIELKLKVIRDFYGQVEEHYAPKLKEL